MRRGLRQASWAAAARARPAPHRVTAMLCLTPHDAMLCLSPHDAMLRLTLHQPHKPSAAPRDALVGGLAEGRVDGGHAVVEREAALHRAVLHKCVDWMVWAVVAQQRGHVALRVRRRGPFAVAHVAHLHLHILMRYSEPTLLLCAHLLGALTVITVTTSARRCAQPSHTLGRAGAGLRPATTQPPA